MVRVTFFSFLGLDRGFLFDLFRVELFATTLRRGGTFLLGRSYQTVVTGTRFFTRVNGGL